MIIKFDETKNSREIQPASGTVFQHVNAVDEPESEGAGAALVSQLKITGEVLPEHLASFAHPQDGIEPSCEDGELQHRGERDEGEAQAGEEHFVAPRADEENERDD